jgi:hypothetical protein
MVALISFAFTVIKPTDSVGPGIEGMKHINTGKKHKHKPNLVPTESLFLVLLEKMARFIDNIHLSFLQFPY